MSHPDCRLDAVTDDAIVQLVDAFYRRVRRDPMLAPVFEGAIADSAWPAHLEKMYAFWSSVMLTSGRYKGNPVAAHQLVSTITPDLFGRWLDLFEATVAELFTPPVAQQFATKARRIAESLKSALFFRPGVLWPNDLRNRPALHGAAMRDGV